MPKYRVRATCTQVYTQFYTVDARTEQEAIERVKRGEVPLTYERLEEIDDITPTHACQVTNDNDLRTPSLPSARGDRERASAP